MIGLDQLSIDIGPAGIRDISLAIKPRTWTFIIGPSGAGKTLILEAIAGLHTMGGGRILMRGIDVSGVSPEKRGIALVYQDYSLFPHMTVAENIAFGPRRGNKSQKEQEQIVTELLNRFRLLPFRDRYPGTLSGGEQQRVAIARALAVQPEILLLDEPFAALDPLIRQEHIILMQQIRRERGLTIVQVSHSREEAFALADQVAVIMEGRLVQAGTCEEVFYHPVTPDVARFAGIENIFSGTVLTTSEGTMEVDVNGWIINANGNLTAGNPVTLCISGRDLQIAPAGTAPGPHQTCMTGVISGVTPKEYMIRAEISGPVPLVAILPREHPVQHRQSGQMVTILIDATAVHVIP
ncbi:MAG: ABC transporter ATP-binding protein, partial [Methanoregula sp.]|nr:ABC transporter ATP-binding protein [Methanoregula sp.]